MPKNRSYDDLQKSDMYLSRFICGYPKTGRTWLRFMLAHALVFEAGIDMNIDLNNVYSLIPNDDAGIIPGQPKFAFKTRLPLIKMSHANYTYSEFGQVSNIVFLTRDPRDIMVSHWMHDKNQVHKYDDNLSSYIRDPYVGIENFLMHLESWAVRININQVVTYESMKQNPSKALITVGELLGVELSHRGIRQSVEASDFNVMQKKEIASGIAGHNYNRLNPDALRVRKGEVGGYSRYLTANDEIFIMDAINKSSSKAKEIISLTGYSVSN